MRKTLFVTFFAVAALSACKARSNDVTADNAVKTERAMPAADNAANSDKARANDVAADNTAKNQRATPTADNAVNSGADRDLTQQIRKAVMDDSSLSTNAHNCKIVVQDGAVTLVGPVASDAERAKVEQIAMAKAGDRKVVNQLEVTR